MPTDFIRPATGTPYATFASLANHLITKWGSTVTSSINRKAQTGKYDPVAGRPVAGSDEVYPCVCVQSQWTFKRQPTRPIAEGTQRFLFAAQLMNVIPNGTIDVLTWDGNRYRFVSGQIIAPGGIPIVFDMECMGVPANASIPNEIAPFEMRVVASDSDILGSVNGQQVIPGGRNVQRG